MICGTKPSYLSDPWAVRIVTHVRVTIQERSPRYASAIEEYLGVLYAVSAHLGALILHSDVW